MQSPLEAIEKHPFIYRFLSVYLWDNNVKQYGLQAKYYTRIFLLKWKVIW